MNKLLFALCLLLGSIVAQAQNLKQYDLLGKIIETDELPLPGATVLLLNAQDSIMVSFGMADNDGAFKFEKIKQGKYVLQVSFMGYHTYFRPIEASGTVKSINVDQIKMLTEATVLEGVSVVGEHIPIMIKGDTIEYNTAAYKTTANASVEDLLKKLPGVEVETDGTITAQGEEVQKILVDGKAFFGDDPKIATKNLPADIVNKIQVFDKMSDMAEFTGVDDGERSKTINLTLKDDKKKGVFGNVSAGYGTSDTYAGKGNANIFKSNTQISLLGAANNINQRGFSAPSQFSFGGGGRNNSSSGNTKGISEIISTGLNLNHKFNKKTKIESSYFFNSIENNLLEVSNRENFLEGRTYNSGATDESISENINHQIDFRLTHKPNELQEFLVIGNVKASSAFGNNSSESEIFGTTGILDNTGSMINNNNGNNLSYTGTIIWRRKFEKVGRNIAFNGNISKTDRDQESILRSIYEYKVADPINSFTQMIDRDQFESNTNDNFGVKFSYTEPLGKKRYLQFNYNLKNFQSNIIKDFYDVFDEDSPQELIVKNDRLSTFYNRGFIYNIGGTKLTINRDKYNLTMGADYQLSELEGQLAVGDEKINKNFNGLLPNIQMSYNFSSSNKMRLSYTTRLQEPSLEQLQPIENQENPQNIYIGNPNLKASYDHRLGLNYIMFNQFSFTNLFARVSASYTEDKITNSVTYDDNYVQTTTPINVERDMSITGFSAFQTPLKFIGAKINIRGTSRYNNGILFINSINMVDGLRVNTSNENITERWVNSVDIGLENRKKNMIDIRGGTKYTFNNTIYSKNTELNQNFITKTFYGNFDLTLPKEWTISSDFRYTIYEGEAFGDDLKVPIWSAFIAKSFLKNNRGQLKLSVFDILNENVGVTRNSNLNYIEDLSYTSLARYGMLTFTYSLSKFGDSAPTSGGHSGRKMHRY